VKVRISRRTLCHFPCRILGTLGRFRSCLDEIARKPRPQPRLVLGRG
jgi:hypothetical protein